MGRLMIWEKGAWEEYIYWQRVDMKMVKKINTLIKEIVREPFVGLGKPEPLKNELAGYWSRRIDDEHRLVYSVSDKVITILQCRFHY